MNRSLRKLCLLLPLLATSSFATSSKLVRIPSGELTPFWLTVVSKKPQPISIGSFESMDRQVTVAEFKDFLVANPQWQKQNVALIFADDSYLANLNEKNIPPNSPMTSVSWFAAKAYCESKGMRLPLTNEWEYMAAASQTKKDASADPDFLKRILNWYGEPQGGQLKNVGTIYKNLYGVWDLHGLVWEWVDDFNSNFVTGESREDSSFNKDMFCGAGGQAGANKENYAAFMRFAFRASLKGKSSIWNLGFRCVR